KQFVQLWMHNRHLLLHGKKMAKSEGETITVDTLKERGYSLLAFRLLIFAHHYRTPIDFSWELLDEYQGHVASILNVLARIPHPTQPPLEKGRGLRSLPLPEGELEGAGDFTASLADDLNTPKAFAIFLKTIKEINSLLDSNHTEAAQERFAQLLAMDSVIGVVRALVEQTTPTEIPQDIIALSTKREQAKQEKNYGEADGLRTQIEAAGFSIQDTPQGPRIAKK
ncbi:MAG: hypothetical protein O3A36_04045, partial [bacterium]|nr:hypothetical protein [bacterium]